MHVGLGIYLILPLPGVTVSAQAELIGGTYSNVTCDIGACIAAGGTLHLVSQGRKRRKIAEEPMRPRGRPHRLLHHVYGGAPGEPGHIAKITQPRVPGGQDQPGPGTETALADLKTSRCRRAVPAGLPAG
jgi:hypothetical protein